MATTNRHPVIIEVDVVLAGVALGQTVATFANPEGRDIIARDILLRRITVDTTGAELRAALEVRLAGAEVCSFAVAGSGASGALEVNAANKIWAAAANLTLVLLNTEGLETAETFVGTLCIEYWSPDRAPGRSSSIS